MASWQDFLRGGLGAVLDGMQPQQSSVPAAQTPVANAQPSQTVQPSTAGLWTHQDTILAGVAAVLVVVLIAMRK